MGHEPHEDETRQVRALPDEDALTPRRGTHSVRESDKLRATRGLSRKHWSGARFVVIVLLLTAIVLILFLALKQMA